MSSQSAANSTSATDSEPVEDLPLPPSPPGHPIVGNTLQYASDVFEFHDSAVEEYGDVVRMDLVGGDIYLLAHPDFFERAMVTQQDAFEKTDDFEIAFGENLNAVEGEQWERQNEALQEFFYPGKIRSYAEAMVDMIELRMETWKDGGEISLHGQMKDVALEILFGTIFDRPLDPNGDEELRWAANSLNEYFNPSSLVLPDWVPTPARHRFKKGKARLNREARRLLAEREEQGGTGDDLLSTMVEVRNSDSELITETEMIDQVAGLTFAGHDTSGLSMAFAWHLLGNHPDVRERFYAELDDVLGGDRPTADDIGDLEFTRKIMQETMRRHTPVHTVPRRAARDIEAHGYRIPEGSDMHLSIHRVHRDPRFWDDPLEFKPSRWDDMSPLDRRYAYIPFGEGPRSCIGERFAKLEQILVLATIGQEYHLEPRTELDFSPEMTSQPSNPLPATVHER